MAVRLSKVFGGSAESWLIQQAQYDLAHVHFGRMKLKKLDWLTNACLETGPCTTNAEMAEGLSVGPSEELTRIADAFDP